MDYSYTYSDKIRDFTPILADLQERIPSITSMFRVGSPVKDTVFYYYDFLEQPVSAQINNGAGYPIGTNTFVVDNEIGTFAAGDRIYFKDSTHDPLIVQSYTAGTHTLVTTANSAAAHSDDCVILRTATPKDQGTELDVSTAGGLDQGTKRTNYTQIFRQDVAITGSSLSIGLEETNDAVIDRAVAQKFLKLYRDLATTLIYGVPVAAAAGVNGNTAGLLYWCRQGSMLSDKSAAALTATMVNDAIEQVFLKSGIDPDVIVCSSATARKVSAFNTATTNNMVIISETSDIGGGIRAATRFTGDLAGTGTKKILVEPNMPDSQLIIGVSSMWELDPLADRTLKDSDTTPKGYDGVARSIIGEYGTKIFNPLYCNYLVYNYT